MNCPKCGFEGTSEVECARCGVVFAKFVEMEGRLLAVRAVPSMRGGRVERRSPVLWIVLAVLAGGAVAWSVRDRPEASVAAATSPSPGPPERPPRDAAALAARAAAGAEVGGTCPLLGPTSPPPRTTVGGSWLETADYEYAVQQQRETGAPLLVYFRTDWCQYCRRLEEGLLAEPEVESRLGEAVVRCRVNPEESPEAQAVSDSYGVTGYPTLFLVAEGLQPVRVTTSGRGDSPRLSPEEFLAGLDNNRRRLAQRLVRAGDGARQQGDLDRALEQLDRAVAISEGGAEALFYRGVARGAAGDSYGAFSDFALVSELAPDDIDVYRQAEELLTQEGRFADAAACWSLYLFDQPQSSEALRRRDKNRARAAAG